MTNNGVHQHNAYSALRQFSAASIAVGLFIGVAPLSASAGLLKGNAYEDCTSSLIDDGLSVDAASSACAEALEPRDISACVDKVIDGTSIEAMDALDSCQRVRRPRDMASCVVRIDNRVGSADPLDVMDYCRRSLLPDDYSDCVVGIDSETDLTAAAVLETCIAADYRLPTIVYPNFEPAEDSFDPVEDSFDPVEDSFDPVEDSFDPVE